MPMDIQSTMLYTIAGGFMRNAKVNFNKRNSAPDASASCPNTPKNSQKRGGERTNRNAKNAKSNSVSVDTPTITATPSSSDSSSSSENNRSASMGDQQQHLATPPSRPRRPSIGLITGGITINKDKEPHQHKPYSHLAKESLLKEGYDRVPSPLPLKRQSWYGSNSTENMNFTESKRCQNRQQVFGATPPPPPPVNNAPPSSTLPNVASVPKNISSHHGYAHGDSEDEFSSDGSMAAMSRALKVERAQSLCRPTMSMSADSATPPRYGSPKKAPPPTPPRKHSATVSAGTRPIQQNPASHSLEVDHLEAAYKSKSLMCLLADAYTDTNLGHSLANSVSKPELMDVDVCQVGPEELDRFFPDRTIRVFVGTWNMNGQIPPDQMSEFLHPRNIKAIPEVLVIGTQESNPEKTEWEIRLQETLGNSFVMFHSCSLGTIHLSVFLKRDLIWYASIPEVDSFNLHPAMEFRTKGSVAMCFILFGTSFLFVNSHLTAHEENVKDRVRDLKKSNAMLNLPRTLPSSKKSKVQRLTGVSDFTDNFDCVFWLGDLNFRLEKSRDFVLDLNHKLDISVDLVMDEVGREELLDFDQLNFMRKEGFIFRGYQEDEIKFPPTFKYDVGTNHFDTSQKQRVPSYTDRILYKYKPSTTDITPMHYESCQHVLTSDHKPVWGMWAVKLRPGTDSIPLSGGLFNRHVYVEGVKRRTKSRTQRIQNKHACVIQ